jgi:hypothetical protein
MTRGRETEQPEGLVHVRSVDAEKNAASTAFRGLVHRFLKEAPNAKGDQSDYQIGTANDFGHPPTVQAVTFPFGNSTVHASFHVDWGSPPQHRLTIITPIIVDNLPDDPWDVGHGPVKPHESVMVTASPYYGDLDIAVKAVTRLGNHGAEIELEQYTAGGLVPPISTEGEGKVKTVNDVVKLFKDVAPQNPTYKKPFAPRARAKSTQ